jgi:hypothetical protein
VGKKKKKEVKKAGVAGQGKTTMNDTPSSRGSQRLVDDKQRETCCPVPTDATNSQQSSAEKAAFLGKIIGRVAQGAGRAVAGAADNVAQKATGAVADGAESGADDTGPHSAAVEHSGWEDVAAQSLRLGHGAKRC